MAAQPQPQPQPPPPPPGPFRVGDRVRRIDYLGNSTTRDQPATISARLPSGDWQLIGDIIPPTDFFVSRQSDDLVYDQPTTPEQCVVNRTQLEAATAKCTHQVADSRRHLRQLVVMLEDLLDDIGRRHGQAAQTAAVTDAHRLASSAFDDVPSVAECGFENFLWDVSQPINAELAVKNVGTRITARQLDFNFRPSDIAMLPGVIVPNTDMDPDDDDGGPNLVYFVNIDGSPYNPSVDDAAALLYENPHTLRQRQDNCLVLHFNIYLERRLLINVQHKRSNLIEYIDVLDADDERLLREERARRHDQWRQRNPHWYAADGP